MSIVDPSARQIVRLYTDHVLGNGMSVTADDEKADTALKTFLADPTNRRRLSPSGQIKESDDLLKDGEWFIWLHDAGQGKTKLRRIDSLEITKIITNPEDKDEVWFYERETIRNNRTTKRWYRDIANKDAAFDKATRTFPSLLEHKINENTGEEERVPFSLPEGIALADSFVHHVTINSTDTRGYSILVAAMIWANQFKNFMENRIVLQRARTMSVWDETIKGSAADIADRKSALNSTVTTSNPWDTKPPAATGSSYLHNEGVERTPVEQKTAAPDAKIDGDMLVQMVGLGSGIFAQYLGQEAYRLTTTRVIEGPMMKAFKVYQQVLFDAFSVIFDFVLENAKVPEEKRQFDIDFPPIVEKARAETMEMLERAVGFYPQLMSSKEVQAFTISLLGINNVDQVLEEIDNSDDGNDDIPATVEEAAVGMSQAAFKFANYMEKEHASDAAEIEEILGGAEVAAIGAAE